ncbi:MAG: hypothetical protein ACC645_08810 [Pirellulales bacterium]
MSEMHVTDVDGENPMVFIPSGKQKNRDVGHYPLTPELVDLLRNTPPDARQGFVFNPLSLDGKSRVGYFRVSHMLAKLGKEARVVVKRYAGGKIKYASAQDLRRTFSERIVDDVPIHVAQQFTRHKSEVTLLKLYAKKNSQDAAKTLRDVRKVGTSVGTSPNPTKNDDSHVTVSDEADGS